jgi:hypothetical protein
MPRRFRIPFVVVVLTTLTTTLVVAGSGAATNPPKPAPDSAISQYVEVVPGAGGAKPTSGPAVPPTASKSKVVKPATTKPAKAETVTPPSPVSAAFATSGGGLGAGTVLAIILGAIALAGMVLFAARRRFDRR